MLIVNNKIVGSSRYENKQVRILIRRVFSNLNDHNAPTMNNNKNIDGDMRAISLIIITKLLINAKALSFQY